MALQSTILNLKELLLNITQDLNKADAGNKAAAQRVRVMTVQFERLAKTYRKESIAFEKDNKGRRPSRRAGAARPKARPAIGSRTKPSAARATKIKPKAKAHTLARPRAFAIKRATAKLPLRRSSW